MAKKKRSPAQIRATKKMLAARRKALKGMHGGVKSAAKKAAKRAKVKSPRKRARTSAPKTERKATRKPRKSSSRSAAAKKAARTRARKKAERSAAAKKAARTRARHGGHAGKKPRKSSGKGRHHAKKGRKSTRRKGRKATHHRKVVQSTRSQVIALPGHTTKVVLAPVPSSSRRSSKKRKSSGKGRKGRKSAKRSAAAKKAAKTRARNKKKGGASEAMEVHGGELYGSENPLGAAEIIFGGIAGLLGFAASEVVDRMVATHALTANGDGTFTDPQGATGSDYSGLYNGTAIVAPMSLMRWGAGIGITVVPFGLAAIVRAPVGKTSLQMFGFGAGIRLLGKALTDLVAQLTANTQFGQQIFVNEQRAISQMPNSPLANVTLPTTGLGAGPCCAGCANGTGCTGTGACCGRASVLPPTAPTPAVVPAQPPAPPPPPPPAPPALPASVPVMMPAQQPNPAPSGRQMFIQPNGSNMPAPPPAPPAQTTSANASFRGVLGLPGVGAVPQRSRFAWGDDPDTSRGP